MNCLTGHSAQQLNYKHLLMWMWERFLLHWRARWLMHFEVLITNCPSNVFKAQLFIYFPFEKICSCFSHFMLSTNPSVTKASEPRERCRVKSLKAQVSMFNVHFRHWGEGCWILHYVSWQLLSVFQSWNDRQNLPPTMQLFPYIIIWLMTDVCQGAQDGVEHQSFYADSSTGELPEW